MNGWLQAASNKQRVCMGVHANARKSTKKEAKQTNKQTTTTICIRERERAFQ